MHEGFLVTEAFISVFLWGEDAQSLKARGVAGPRRASVLRVIGLSAPGFIALWCSDFGICILGLGYSCSPEHYKTVGPKP